MLLTKINETQGNFHVHSLSSKFSVLVFSNTFVSCCTWIRVTILQCISPVFARLNLIKAFRDILFHSLSKETDPDIYAYSTCTYDSLLLECWSIYEMIRRVSVNLFKPSLPFVSLWKRNCRLVTEQELDFDGG
jgi:hypothetical protein